MERKGQGEVLAVLTPDILAYGKTEFSRELESIRLRKPFPKVL